MEARLFAVEQKLVEVSTSEPWAERVGWLRCFRGIDTVTSMTIVAELHDFRRFHSARQLMCYLGLVSREYLSGESQHRGGLTKAGNSHVRRVLVEAAWHYRHRPAVELNLRQRRRGQPAAMIALADRAQQRLYGRYGRLVLGRGKPPPLNVQAHVPIPTRVAGALRSFELDGLRSLVGELLSEDQIRAVVKRRDRLVRMLENESLLAG